jgi:flagellar biosynthesis protein FlhG
MSEFERQTLVTQFHRLHASTDIVVLDCGAGLSRNVLSFALCADRVIVVTTQEPPAVTDAYAMIKSLHQERCTARIGLFVNRVEQRAAADATFERIAGVAERFLKISIANQGYMLQDRVVEAAVMARRPFVICDPGSPASACIAALADTIVRTTSGESRSGGWFRRVAGLFV